MSTVIEVGGLALIALGACTLWGIGVAEAVGGVELLVLAWLVEGAKRSAPPPAEPRSKP